MVVWVVDIMIFTVDAQISLRPAAQIFENVVSKLSLLEIMKWINDSRDNFQLSYRNEIKEFFIPVSCRDSTSAVFVESSEKK